MFWLLHSPNIVLVIIVLAAVTAVTAPIAGVYGDRGYPLLPRLIPTVLVTVEPLLIYVVRQAPNWDQGILLFLVFVGWLVGQLMLLSIGNYFRDVFASKPPHETINYRPR